MTKLQTGVSYSKYMALYTVSYNYCTSSKMHGGGETLGMAGRSKSLPIHASATHPSAFFLSFFYLTWLIDNVPAKNSRRKPHGIRSVQQPHPFSCNPLTDAQRCLFSRLITDTTVVNGPFYLTQASESLQDEALLQYYAREWDRYTTGANYINRLFTYLNRHWVKRERDEGRKGVYPVYTVRLFSLRSFIAAECMLITRSPSR